MKTEQIPGANILIVESAEASDRKQAIQETIIEDLKETRRERDLYFEQLMDAKRRELTNSIKFERLKDIAVSYCQRFEALWDRLYGHPSNIFYWYSWDDSGWFNLFQQTPYKTNLLHCFEGYPGDASEVLVKQIAAALNNQEKSLPTDIFSYEEMEEYCSHAKFLVTCLKREYNIVSLVEEKMKEWKV